MRVLPFGQRKRDPHYILTQEEIDLFVKLWNDRENYPEVSDVREELCYINNKRVLNIATQLRNENYQLIERGLSIISDEDLIKVWNDKISYPTIKDIGDRYHLAPRWISVRVSELRAIHGLEIIPYRGKCHYDLRAANARRRAIEARIHSSEGKYEHV
jgi:hypothetical protein